MCFGLLATNKLGNNRDQSVKLEFQCLYGSVPDGNLAGSFIS